MFLPEPIDKIELAGIWRHNEYFDSGLFRRQMKPIVGYVYVAILSIGNGFLLCWYSVLGQPRQKPIEKLKLKLRYDS